jgi:hypothetical protein
MNLAETLRFAVVAGGTKGRFVESKECGLRPGMRDMAGQAVLRSRKMGQLAAEVVGAVAAHAEIFLGLPEQRRIVGPVRIVARAAGLDTRMHVRSLQFKRVAVITKLGLVLFEP